MPRVQYKAWCDACQVVLNFPNDENDLQMNGLKAVLCPPCNNRLFSFYETMKTFKNEGKLFRPEDSKVGDEVRSRL
jgi:hypothetical protein